MSIVGEEELSEIVEVVCMTLLEMPIESGDASEVHSTEHASAEIQITGAWFGIVALKASKAFLNQAASLMFSCSLEDVSDRDRMDTLTELTNMIGGTVKCLLPEYCDLSLPTVLNGDLAESTDVEWVGFFCDASPLAVSVTETMQASIKAA